MIDLTAISRRVWDMKYRLKLPDGAAVDKTLDDTWDRVATAVSASESDSEFWRQQFLNLIRDFRFLPAGRILAGAGTDRQVTLFNCFVMGTIPDSLAGIFDHLREAALTLQQGGGIGYDFSSVRPKGAPVLGIGADASGPLSFMEVWDSMCRTIMSAGSRRGAMMATLRCDHPDIEAFVAAKGETGRLSMFNLSVLVTDSFIAAVRTGADWPLSFAGKVHRVVPARGLWDRIMRATYDYAEPGVLFIDRINETNNLHYCETIAATNPCGEQPLPPYGACLLGSLNLTRFVVNPFSADASLDLDALLALVPVAVRFLDNTIDISRFPLPQQKVEAEAKRRIGLGVTGLADALIACGIRYGSPQAVACTRDWIGRICDAAYRASALIAAEKGAFPLYRKQDFLAAPMVQRQSPQTQALIAQHGIRNALLTSIAPTGTISLLANNVSSGIEPVFAYDYNRTVLMPDGTTLTERIEDDAYRQFRALRGPDAQLTPAFVDVAGLTPEDHLVMQAAAQDGIDSSISKTINVPADLPFEEFGNVYLRAYDLGCKGCTTYRPNSVRAGILSSAAAPEIPRDEEICPNCGSPWQTEREGCVQCPRCGHSLCV